jgi:catechol 2,3-dioxygenase-like lactoylglutathione lyase family enzyme
MPKNLSSLGQIALTVRDIETATAFYRDTLELGFLFAAPPKLAFFDLDGIRLMLSEPEPGQTLTGNSTLYFNVDDIHAAYEALQARGVRFEDAPHLIATLGSVELWMAFFRDPDNNLLGIMSEVPASG